MPFSSLYDASLTRAHLRAISTGMGRPHGDMPVPTMLAALAKHGGMYTLLDPAMMSARASAFAPGSAASAIVAKARDMADAFFYKLVDKKGYTIHSELMAYIAEPGLKNGVSYDECAEPSPDVPAVFTFVGQFIDHDLTFNGMNLTVDQTQAVFADDASPTIDLDSVYGPRPRTFTDAERETVETHIFDKKGRFRLRPVLEGRKVLGYDLCRHEAGEKSDCGGCANDGMPYVFDPRNDENQLILQVHVLVERFHNALIHHGVLKIEPGESGLHFAQRVRREVVATWQSMVLNDYMRRVILPATRDFVLGEIRKKATDPAKPQEQYGDLRHKPYKDLVTGKNVVRMPHEFAIGFRFGHSQLRPMYLLSAKRVVLLFKDARASAQVDVCLPDGKIVHVDGSDDLRGGRPLLPTHVIDWSVFYPEVRNDATQSMRIDGLVTARVFNLPESAIPDDIKYIGNLPHRNLIRSSQIGVVSGEELADFYGTPRLTQAQVLGEDAGHQAAIDLFMLDKECPEDAGEFKTPLWYYLLKEAETNAAGDRGKLGPLGSRLVAEVLAGACYYGDEYPYDDAWVSKAFRKGDVSLRDIIDYVEASESANGECL